MESRVAVGRTTSLTAAPRDALNLALRGRRFATYPSAGIPSCIETASRLDPCLAGARLLWAIPADECTTDEIGAMTAFLGGGGRIGFLGEWYGFAGARDASISAALAALGGHVAIQSSHKDDGYPHYAYRSNGKIAEDPFTDLVNSMVYGLFSPAKALVLGEDGSSVLLAYEPIGSGIVFVMADQSPWDLDPYSSGTDNRTLFTNMLLAPEPVGTGAAALDGLITVGLARRRAAPRTYTFGTRAGSGGQPSARRATR